MTTMLWRAPSGRHHWQRWCSSGAGNRMTQVRLTDTELAALSWPHGGLCLCAQGARRRAAERLQGVTS